MFNIGLILKGIALGIGNVLPGVSGGTVAVLLNIYDDIVRLANDFFKTFKIKKEDWRFVISLGLGGVVGIIGFARLFEVLVHRFPLAVSLILLVLILGSLPMVIRQHIQWSFQLSTIFPLLLGLSITLFMAFQAAPSLGQSDALYLTTPFMLILSGVFAASAMVIPGISGSLVLLILGTYLPILSAVAALNLAVIGWVCLGAGIGAFVAFSLMGVLLKKYPNGTYLFILGLIIGSIPSLFSI